jgi:hypothetical protein
MKNILFLLFTLTLSKCFAFDIFRMEIQGNGFADETVIVFSDNASDTFNIDEDSPKLFSPIIGVPGICTKITNNYITINQYSPLIVDKTCQLVLKITTSGVYTLYASEFASINSSSQIFLEDLQTGLFVDLRQNQYYSCQLSTGMIENRFLLHFKAPLIIESSVPSCINTDAVLNLNYNSAQQIQVDVVTDTQDTILHLQNFNGAISKDSMLPGNYTFYIVYPNSQVVTTYHMISTNYPVTSSVQVSSDTIVLGEQVIFMLTTNNSTQNIWNFGDGQDITTIQNNVIHNYQQSGQYQVQIISTNSICSDTLNCMITVLETTGFNELNLLNKTKIRIVSDYLGRQIQDQKGLLLVFDGIRYKKVYIK